MDETETTTIAVSHKTKAMLDKLKIHPNQSYDEAIAKLIMRIKL